MPGLAATHDPSMNPALLELITAVSIALVVWAFAAAARRLLGVAVGLLSALVPTGTVPSPLEYSGWSPATIWQFHRSASWCFECCL